MSAQQKLAELNLTLPPAPSSVGLYQPAITVGNQCWTSGHLPLLEDGSFTKGCVGRDLDQEAGQQAARQCGLAILSTLQKHLGNLDRVHRVIKIVGMVWSTPDFDQHPYVINGCSELFRDVFGQEAGIGARSAVGMSSLPLQAAVEIEAIFEIVE